MRFDFTVHADTPAELRMVLASVQSALPSSLFDAPTRQFAINVTPDHHYGNTALMPTAPSYALPGDGDVSSATVTAPAAEADVENAAAVAPIKTRVRRTKAQIEADHAAAIAAQAPAADPVPEDETTGAADDETTGAADDEGTDEAETTGANDDAPEAEAPASPGTLAPAEAKLKALDKLREAYALTGGPAAVKTLQKAYNVAKFVEVPDAEGGNLLLKAEALLASLAPAGAEADPLAA